MKFLLQALVFIFVSVVTWQLLHLVSAQVRQVQPANPPQPRGRMVASGSQSLGTTIPPSLVLPEGTQVRIAIANRSIRKFRAVTNNEQLEVSGYASVQDRRKDFVYVWGIQFILPNSLVLAHKIYTDQQFAIDEDGEMERTFVERFEVPPIDCQVVLTLYCSPKALDLNVLQDEIVASRYKVAMSSSKLLSF